ncbi:hypothetical protein KW795_01680 [Candidatus Microgenomates bacterium]|nr:hypothetical protein [Candidatus Microgenomates bacterium]
MERVDIRDVINNGNYVEVTSSAIRGFDHILNNQKPERNGRTQRAISALEVIFAHNFNELAISRISVDEIDDNVRQYISNTIKIGHLLAKAESSMANSDQEGWYEKPLQPLYTVYDLETELGTYMDLSLEKLGTTTNISILLASKIRSLPQEFALKEIENLKQGAKQRISLAEECLQKVISGQLIIHPSRINVEQVYLARASVANAYNNYGYLNIDEAYFLRNVNSMRARMLLANSQELFDCALESLGNEGRHLPKVARASILPAINKAYANVLFAEMCLLDPEPNCECISDCLNKFYQNIFTDAYKRITREEIDCPDVPNLQSFKNETSIRICQVLDFILKMRLDLGTVLILNSSVEEQSKKLIEKIFRVNGEQISERARINDMQLNFELINFTKLLLEEVLNDELEPEDKIEAQRVAVSFGKTVKKLTQKLNQRINFKRQNSAESDKIAS